MGPFDLGSDGTRKDLILVPNGGSRQRSRAARPPVGSDPRDDHVHVVGGEVFQHAVRRMCQSTRNVLDSAGWSLDDVARLLPHQANHRIATAVARRLDLPEDRLLSNIEQVGNTAGASIPLLLARTWERGLLRPGDKVVITAFGGGLTWGSAAISWPSPGPPEDPLGRE